MRAARKPDNGSAVEAAMSTYLGWSSGGFRWGKAARHGPRLGCRLDWEGARQRVHFDFVSGPH